MSTKASPISKNKFIIILAVCLIMVILGLVLFIINKTPYESLKLWISCFKKGIMSGAITQSEYDYAVANIGRVSAFYFGGIVLFIVGIAGIITTVFLKFFYYKNK